jgi:regulator of replication initiation timing
MSTIKTFTIEDIDKKISDLQNTLSKLKIQRKKIIDESTYTEFENQKDVQVFWS